MSEHELARRRRWRALLDDVAAGRLPSPRAVLVPLREAGLLGYTVIRNPDRRPGEPKWLPDWWVTPNGRLFRESTD